MASTFYNSIAATEDDDGRNYPHVRSARQKNMYSLLTVATTSSIALVATAAVAGIGAINYAERHEEMSQTYGKQLCAPGRSMHRLPVNNYASCCSHYGTTCCDLRSDSCESKFHFSTALPTSGRSGHADAALPKCELMLSLLSCARCSPYAGHYVHSENWLVHKPNLTVCENFCRELWDACVAPMHPELHAGVPDAPEATAGADSPHWRFCTERLGVHVGGAVRSKPGDGDGVSEATCFNAARPGKPQARWLSLGGPALASLGLAVLARTGAATRTREPVKKSTTKGRGAWCGDRVDTV